MHTLVLRLTPMNTIANLCTPVLHGRSVCTGVHGVVVHLCVRVCNGVLEGALLFWALNWYAQV